MNNPGKQGPPPSAPLVAMQLQRILANERFLRAPSLSRLLVHIVELRLRDETASLKEYALGVEVFRRGAEFDPGTDTIVRVHARRLRDRLDAYYADAGKSDPIRIDVPKGRYEPTFILRNAEPAHLCTPMPPSLPGTADGAPGNPAVSVRLPAPRTELVGRERELVELGELLQQNHVRLLTLTGAGGSGKTRLALQVARNCSATFAGGVRFIDLAPVTDAETVVSVLARELGVRRTGGRTLQDAVIGHLGEHGDGSTLLLLDNVEHVMTAAPFFGALLDACASLKLLATSRVPLHLYGEHEYQVAPLTLPERNNAMSAAALASVPSVALLVRRAAAVNATVALDGEDGRAIMELLHRLDGLPLAIELVAPHARTLSGQQLLQRFGDGLDLPGHPATDIPERQRTLRRTIGWSHDLLSTGAQTLLRRLSVFSGSFTLEAVEAVAGVRGDPGFDLVSGVSVLADNSLLHITLDSEGPRFGMLDSIRRYAHEQLLAHGENVLYHRALAAWSLVIAEEGAGSSGTAHRESWLQLCDREHDNLRGALDDLLARGDCEWSMRLALALFPFWERREHLGEGRQRLAAVLALAAGQPVGTSVEPIGRAHNYLGALEALMGDFPASSHSFQSALGAARATGDELSQAASLNALATTAMFEQAFARADGFLTECVRLCRGLQQPVQLAAALSNHAKCRLALDDADGALALLHESRTVFAGCGDAAGVAWCDNHAADIALAQGDSAGALENYQRALAAFRRLKHGWGEAQSLTDLGHLALRQDAVETARECFVDALSIFARLDHRRGVSRLLEGCACVAARAGLGERALTLAGAARAIRAGTGMVPRPGSQQMLEECLLPVRTAQSATRCQAMHDRGMAMGLDAAIEYAMTP